MSDWKPEIVRIQKIEPHPNADRLEIATVVGNPVVVSKGDYSVGDLAAYIPIDTVVPDNRVFAFLIPPKQVQVVDENGKTSHVVTKDDNGDIVRKFEVGSVPENFRIVKAKKIRGIYSQGLLIKGTTADYGEIKDWVSPKQDIFPFQKTFSEGDSITEFFQLTKWEEPEDDESRFHNTGCSSSEKCYFKTPYYDLQGANKYASCIYNGELVVLEEKIHGCNSCFTHDGNRLWVKSRTLVKPRDSEGVFWDIANRYELERKLAEYPMFAFFGEIYGFQKNKNVKFVYDTDGISSKVRFFDIYDIKNNRYLDWNNRSAILSELELPQVPFLKLTTWNPELWEDLKAKFGEGKSTIADHIREGFVLRTVKERFEPKLDSRMIIKYVGRDYNLSKLMSGCGNHELNEAYIGCGKCEMYDNGYEIIDLFTLYETDCEGRQVYFSKPISMHNTEAQAKEAQKNNWYTHIDKGKAIRVDTPNGLVTFALKSDVPMEGLQKHNLEALKKQAINKLTSDERKALGLL